MSRSNARHRLGTILVLCLLVSACGERDAQPVREATQDVEDVVSKPAPPAPAVRVHVDNKGRSAGKIQIGAVMQDVTADAKVVLSVPLDSLGSGLAVAWDGEVITQLPPTTEEGDFLLDRNAARVYRWRSFQYATPDAPVWREGGAVGTEQFFRRKHVHRIPRRPDYFFRKAPTSIRVIDRQERASRTELTWMTGPAYVRLVRGNRLACSALSPDGSLLAYGGAEEEVWHLVNIEQGRTLHTVRDQTTGRVLSISFAPDGNRVAVWDTRFSLRLFDVRAGSLVQTLRFEGVEARYSGNGKALVGTSSDRYSVILLNPASLAVTGKTKKINDTTAFVSLRPDRVAVSRDGRHVAAVATAMSILRDPKSKRVFLWDADDLSHPIPLQSADVDCVHAAFAGNPRHLVGVSETGTIVVWDIESTKILATQTVTLADGELGNVASIAMAPDGRTLALGTGGTIAFWDLKDAKLIRSIVSPSVTGREMSFSADGRTFVGGAGTSIVLIESSPDGGFAAPR